MAFIARHDAGGNKEIDLNTAEKRKRHGIREVESKESGAENDLERAEIRDLRGGTGYHEGGEPVSFSYAIFLSDFVQTLPFKKLGKVYSTDVNGLSI